ncbi:hypothetical protein ACS4N0_13415, partial [Levilactobacillus zymae]|uniref:hypothetical protein n=1 Tax=Levilactobacillus zymae TaxID=267363 RepID=UPI003FCC58AA
GVVIGMPRFVFPQIIPEFLVFRQSLDNATGSLLTIAEAAGYSWTQKIIGNVMVVANVDALGGTKDTKLRGIEVTRRGAPMPLLLYSGS